jgi:hypothetical protein
MRGTAALAHAAASERSQTSIKWLQSMNVERVGFTKHLQRQRGVGWAGNPWG